MSTGACRKNVVFGIVATIFILIPGMLPLPGYGSPIRFYHGEINVNEVISEVIRDLRLNVANPQTYYDLYLSGRIIRIKASDISFLVGQNPSCIIFAAHSRYNGWEILPLRIYERVIENNITRTYVIPKEISKDTIIEIKLPQTMPIRTDPYKNPPEFARGALGVRELEIISKEEGFSLGFVYVFFDNVGGPMYWRTSELWTLNAVDYKYIQETFEAKHPPRLLDYLRILKYSERYIEAVSKRLCEEKIDVGTAISLKVNQPLYDTPLPDGGGSTYVYNIIELRTQPTKEMLEEDIVLTSENPSYEFVLYTKNPDEQTILWDKIRLNIHVYYSSGDKTAPILRLYIDNELKECYGLLYEVPNTITYDIITAYGSYDKDLLIRIELEGLGSNSEWKLRVIPTAYIYWSNLTGIESKRVHNTEIVPLSTSEIKFYFDQGHKTDYNSFYLQLPSATFSTGNPQRLSTFKLRAELEPTTLPEGSTVSIRMYLNGVASNTVTLSRSLTTGYLQISLLDSTLLAYASTEEPMEIKLEAIINEIPQGQSFVMPIIIFYLEESFVVKSRIMLPHADLYKNGIVLYTSTFEENSHVWEETDKYPVLYRTVYNAVNYIGGNDFINENVYITFSRIRAAEIIEESNCEIKQLHYRISIQMFGANGILPEGATNRLVSAGATSLTIKVKFPSELISSGPRDVIIYEIKKAESFIETALKKITPIIAGEVSKILFKCSLYGTLAELAIGYLYEELVSENWEYTWDAKSDTATISWEGNARELYVDLYIEDIEEYLSEGVYPIEVYVSMALEGGGVATKFTTYLYVSRV